MVEIKSQKLEFIDFVTDTNVAVHIIPEQNKILHHILKTMGIQRTSDSTEHLYELPQENIRLLMEELQRRPLQYRAYDLIKWLGDLMDTYGIIHSLLKYTVVYKEPQITPATMNFGEALEKVTNAGCISRLGWHKSDMYVRYWRPDWRENVSEPYLYLTVPDEGVVVWTPSHTDILAKDWIQVYPREED